MQIEIDNGSGFCFGVTTSELGSSRMIERPKLLYNAQTGKYLVWCHYESGNYGASEAAYYREMNINGTMFTDSGYFTPAQGEQTFDSMPGQQVSIFNFGCKTITSEGLRWNSYAYQELWQGTLNESLADHFTMRADGFYMIFRTYSNN